MNQLLDIIEVEANKNNKLQLTFENKERKLFDMTAYLEKKPFNKLKNSSLFMQARIEYGTVAWPGNIDIAPETLYDYSIPNPLTQRI